MEIKWHIQIMTMRCVKILPLLLFWVGVHAQPMQNIGKCEFKNGEFSLQLNKHAATAQLEQFIIKYDLKDLDLQNVLRTNNLDTLTRLGWQIVANSNSQLVIKKPLSGSSNIDNVVQNMEFSPGNASIASRFPSTGSGLFYGYNHFKNKQVFAIKDNIVTFYLRNHLNAAKVVLAGSFNGFSPEEIRMRKTDSGWVAPVKLLPGKYWYKFVEDGKWMEDADNYLRENDEEGNTNSVYYQPNYTFKIKGFANAKKIFVTGSFNGWKKQELLMIKVAGGWQLPVYLGDGTHTYKYIIDNVYYTDPLNPDRITDGNGGENSVIKFGSGYTFKLNGFTDAKQVVLAGTFNQWREKELQMQRTNTGWELLYTIGPGNYQYKFIVDGKWINDPANPLTATLEGETNSYIIIGANYTFKLKGMEKAKTVFLAGDFNNWDPNTLAMNKVGTDWVCSVYLSPGKHKYKYIVDGNWITDPNNKTWEQNEHNTGNSVIWVDKL